MKPKLLQWLLALCLLASAIGLFIAVVVKGLGGNEALFLVIGHLAAWGEMVVIYYFRKKAPET